jgi:hypothetical protein
MEGKTCRQFTQNMVFRLLQRYSRDILIRVVLSSQFDPDSQHHTTSLVALLLIVSKFL